MEDYIYNTINDLRTSGEPLKYYGIRSVNCYAPVISSNTITPVPFNGNQPGASSDINTGIQIENTWAATLNCNVIRKTGTSLVVSGANPMATITNNDFVKSYYGIYTKNSGYTCDLGNDTHPADNQWVGIANLRQQYTTSPGSYELMFCRSTSSYWPVFHPSAPYYPTAPVTMPSVYNCPQQIIIDPTDKAQKTVTQDMLLFTAESKAWVKRGMNKIVKNDLILHSDSVLAIFIDSVKNSPIGFLDSVLVLREMALTNEAIIANSAIIPESNMDELDKEINEFYLKVDSSGTISLSQNEVDRIREIAILCPFTDGEAVYRARILAAAFDAIDTEYSNPCEIEPVDKSAIKNSIIVDNEFSVFPNPSNGKIQISSETIEGSVFMKLFDISGRCVWSGLILINTEAVELGPIENGVYHYQVTTNGETFFGSLVIVKD